MSASAPSIGTNGKELHHQTQLFWLRRWSEPDAPSVAYFFPAGEIPHLVANRGRLRGRKIGAPAVQPLVAGQQLGPLLREALEEVLARPGFQVEDARPDAAGAGFAGRAHDLGQLLGTVGDPREDRRHPHAR